MRIVALALLFLGVPWIVWSVTVTVLYSKLKKRMRGLNEPVLWLSRAERREHARKLLHRQDDEYEQRMMERLTNYMKGGTE